MYSQLLTYLNEKKNEMSKMHLDEGHRVINM